MPNFGLFKIENDKQRSFVQKPLFLFLLAIFSILNIGIYLFWPARLETRATDLSPENILNAVNKERTSRNLLALTTNNKLSVAAQSKTDDMQARHYFAHVDPDGKYIWDKIVAAGYTPYVQLGENLAIEFYDTASLVNAWMNSPTHRANILQEGFKDQGMGITFGNQQAGQYYSAIANTFGALAVSIKTQPQTKGTTTTSETSQNTQTAQPAAAAKSTEPTATKKTTSSPKTTNNGTKTPAATASTQTASAAPASISPTTTSSPVKTRGELALAQTENNTEQNFALPQTATTSTSTETGITLPETVFNAPENTLSDFDISRYVILICGGALLFLMLHDLKTALAGKFQSIDKKLNNIALLIISIITIAFLYWM